MKGSSFEAAGYSRKVSGSIACQAGLGENLENVNVK